jgi:hypothetical protein
VHVRGAISLGTGDERAHGDDARGRRRGHWVFVEAEEERHPDKIIKKREYLSREEKGGKQNCRSIDARKRGPKGNSYFRVKKPLQMHMIVKKSAKNGAARSSFFYPPSIINHNTVVVVGWYNLNYLFIIKTTTNAVRRRNLFVEC